MSRKTQKGYLLHRSALTGFTLAELLIALAILGVIATFTIPKVLQSQQDGSSNAIAKETAGMVSQAYMMHVSKNGISSSTKMSDLTQYMNYIKRDSVTLLDGNNNATSTLDCGGSYVCYQMHNGSMTAFSPVSFGGTAITNAIWFWVDPDGTNSGVSTGPSKSIAFWIYINGQIRTWGTLEPNTTDSSSFYNATPSKDPSWFHWN